MTFLLFLFTLDNRMPVFVLFLFLLFFRPIVFDKKTRKMRKFESGDENSELSSLAERHSKSLCFAQVHVQYSTVLSNERFDFIFILPKGEPH